MEFSNSVKSHQTPIDSKGNYKIYVVHKKDNLFIFEYWECFIVKNVTEFNDARRGERISYLEFSDLQEALLEYKKYVHE